MGTSPWPEDYELLDVPWERRGKRMDECIDVIRGLTGGGYFEYHGEVFDVPAVKMAPTPTEPIPILIGGHGEAALRRAAVMGDGWMHGGGDPADLPGLLARLAELRAEAGRDDEPFETHVISMDAFSVDGVRRLEEQGVTDVIVGFRWPYVVGPDVEPLQAKIDSLRRFADTVITKVKAVDPSDTQVRATGRRQGRRGDGHSVRDVEEVDGDVRGQGPRRVAGALRRRRRGRGPRGPVVRRPRGQGPARQGGHHRLLRQRDLAEREPQVHHPPDSIECGDEVANIGEIRITLPGNQVGIVPLANIYKVNAEGKLVSLRSFWEQDKLSFTDG